MDFRVKAQVQYKSFFSSVTRQGGHFGHYTFVFLLKPKKEKHHQVELILLHFVLFHSIRFPFPTTNPIPQILINGFLRDGIGPEAHVRATAIVPGDKIRLPPGRLWRRRNRRGRSLQPPQVSPAPARVYRYSGGVRKRRAEESEARVAAGAGGGEADPVGAASDWPVHGDGGPEQRHRRINHRIQLLCTDPQYDQPRAAQTLCLRCAPPPLQRARRRPPAGG